MRETVCGLPLALSVSIKVPFLVPGAVGVKVTPTLQLLPETTLVPHVVVEGSRAKSPLATVELKASVAAPLLVTFTVLAPLDVPATWLLKVTLVVERVAVWANAGAPVAAMKSSASDAPPQFRPHRLRERNAATQKANVCTCTWHENLMVKRRTLDPGAHPPIEVSGSLAAPKSAPNSIICEPNTRS